jgi:hypothetical protein
MIRHGGFCTNGMGSQHAFCFPEKDMVLVSTGDTQAVPGGSDLILDRFWETLYSRVSDGKLPENKAAFSRLDEKLRCLEFPPVDGAACSPLAGELSGKTWILDENPMGIKTLSFDFARDGALMRYANATGDHELPFGLGRYCEGVFPETHYFGRRIGQPLGRGYRAKAAGAWFNPQSLTVYVYLIDDYLGTLKMNFFFKDDQITLIMSKAAEWFLDEYSGTASGRLAPQRPSAPLIEMAP